MKDISLTRQRRCLNCGSDLTAKYCPCCGQQDREIKRPLFGLLREFINAVFELDGKAYRTVFFLFSKPGYLSKEYIRGRRASFTPPLRLFLVLSVSFFFIISLNSFIETLDSSLSGQTETSDTESSENSITFGDDETDGITRITGFINSITVPFLDAKTNANLVAFMSLQAEANYARIMEDPESFFYGSLDYTTVFILLMMPLLAMIMKIFYYFSRQYYVEHMILTLHNHTFLMLAMIIRILLSFIADSSIAIVSFIADLSIDILTIWMFCYFFMSLKYYYEENYLLTALKFTAATTIYAMLLAVGLTVFMGVFFILA